MPKRHLLRRRRLHGQRRAACGLTSPGLATTKPEQVTCLACQRTTHMADAIAREEQKKKPFRHLNKREK